MSDFIFFKLVHVVTTNPSTCMEFWPFLWFQGCRSSVYSQTLMTVPREVMDAIDMDYVSTEMVVMTACVRRDL